MDSQKIEPMQPKLSIIIPCYNSQATIAETIESIIDQEFQNWEVIIVNDGSTDKSEDIIKSCIQKDQRFRYYSKGNEGLGKTRNFGILKAKGTYILPLDSDNLVASDFATDAIEILDKQQEIGVVHGHAEYIGEKSGKWIVPEYDMEKLLVHNYIDACAIYRKELWEQVEGYDEGMPFHGHEDWDLWISFGLLQVNFFHLKKLTFKYRITSTSMIKSLTDEMVDKNIDYLVKKYSRLYYTFFRSNYTDLKLFRNKPDEGVKYHLKQLYKAVLKKSRKK